MEGRVERYGAVAIQQENRDCQGPAAADAYPLLVGFDRNQVVSALLQVQGGARNVEDIYPLSSLQEGMLFHYLLNECGDTYMLSALLEVQPAVQLSVLVGALETVIDRHAILRTAVLWEELPQAVQVVYRRASLIPEEVVAGAGCDVRGQLKQRMLIARERMDLRKAPLIRLLFAKQAENVPWYALLQIHHVICDHQSLWAVVNEMMAVLSGNVRALPSPVSYRDFVAEEITHSRTHDPKSFFRQKLGDVTEPTAPFGLLDVHGDGSRITESRQVVDPILSNRIKTVAQRVGVTPARLFHAAWAIVLRQTTGRSDVVFGTVLLVSRQKNTRDGRMLGMSVNTLPLRLRIGNGTATELVDRVDDELSSLLRYGHTPLQTAQRCSDIAGSAPLFTTLFNFRHNVAGREAVDSAIRVLEIGEAWTSYPITVLVDDLGERFGLTAQVDERIGADRMTGYLRTAMESLLEALEGAPQSLVSSLSILPEGERRECYVR